MLKVLIQTLILGVLLGASAARAELPADYKVVLLTENFPPFNMAVDDKNFARDDGIDGISADIVREMFRRAGISYSLSLRFPWDRLYRLTLDKPGYGLFSMTYTPSGCRSSSGSARWPTPVGCCWRRPAARSP